MKKSLLAALALAFCVFIAGPCLANEGDGENQHPTPLPQADAGPCKQDAEKLCPGMHPGDGKFAPCMNEHKKEVSAECRSKMGKIAVGKVKAHTMTDPCEADAAKLCPGMKAGGGMLGDCMKEHKDQASEACRQKLAKIAPRRAKKGADGGKMSAPGDDGKAPAGSKTPDQGGDGQGGPQGEGQ